MAAQATHKESLLEPEEEEPPDILDLELEYIPEESLGTMEPEYTSDYTSEEPQDTLEPKHTSEPQDRLELECTTGEFQDRLEPECTTEESQTGAGAYLGAGASGKSVRDDAGTTAYHR